MKTIQHAVLAVLALGAAPVFAKPTLTADGDQIMPGGGRMVIRKGVSLRSVEWRQHDIPVCWINPAVDDAAARAMVRQAMLDTWEAAANVHLTGWRDCNERGSPSKMVRILVSDAEWPRAMVGINALSRRAPTVFLNFHLSRRPGFAGCASKEDRCLRFSAVHEIGHVLGLIHEQDRPETPADCIAGLAPGQRQRQNIADLNLLTGYDPVSLMNYCSARGYDPQMPLTLSSEDTVAIRKLFGSPVAALQMAAVPAGALATAANTPQASGALPAEGTKPSAAAPSTPPGGTAPASSTTQEHTKPRHPVFDPN